jgi:hypothetical protein
MSLELLVARVSIAHPRLREVANTRWFVPKFLKFIFELGAHIF